MKIKPNTIKITILTFFCLAIGVAFVYNGQKKISLIQTKEYKAFAGSAVFVNSEKFTINKDRFFVISLNLIEGNGYSWYRTDNSNFITLIDKKVIDLNNTVLEIQKGNRKIGGKIFYLWKFQAIKKGKINLQFQYYRYWEGAESSIKTRIYHINVQ